jgi:CubicO group peptidase (beta-lactamase class C family)
MESTGYFENADDLALGYLDRYTTEPVPTADVSALFASGGLYSTVEDLFQWNQAIFSERLLPRAIMDQMFTPHAVTGDGGEGYAAYGYAWFLLEHKGHAVVWHSGSIDGFTSILAHHPDEQVTIILLSNTDREIVHVAYWSGALCLGRQGPGR